MIPYETILLLCIHGVLLSLFVVFSAFNYTYALAAFRQRSLPTVEHSKRRIAVVVVGYNEHTVLPETLHSVDALDYPNYLTIVADDSDDLETVQWLRDEARRRGCVANDRHGFYQTAYREDGSRYDAKFEILESSDFVVFHRPGNEGFKAGSLARVVEYLEQRDIELMYLLDADWHPSPNVLDETLSILEADPSVAFVQTKRLSRREGMNVFQRYATLAEEGCYEIDFLGRQNLDHPILFSGCCTLFRLDALNEVGGFQPGHLTEDLDLSNRLWLEGWKGVYASHLVNRGEVPFTYDHYRRQQGRWAAGSGRALRTYASRIMRNKNMSWVHRLSALRQNAYFAATLLTGIAIVLGVSVVAWLIGSWNSWAVEYYLYCLDAVRLPLSLLVFFCIFSNFVQPLTMILLKQKRPSDLIHLPMMVWYAWSVIPTYAIGNLKGMFGIEERWFRTPKYERQSNERLPRTPLLVRTLNITVCLLCLAGYFWQGWVFGWFDFFSILIIPAFVLASVR